MHLIHPDVLAEARGLSVGASAFFLFVGIMLWAFGWRWHRFWVVFSLTVFAGMVGMNAGRATGTQVLVVGVLLAVAAGMLALELAKILAFVTGGTAAWFAAANVVPNAQELWAVFLCGGLIGVALYRLWTMLATSFIGVIIGGHCLVLLCEPLYKFEAFLWAGKNTAALNGAVIGLTVVGILVQVRTGRNEVTEINGYENQDVISMKELSKALKKLAPPKAA